MADANLGNVLDVTDKRGVQGASTQVIATPANYASISTKKTRLNAISSTTYTAARLATMTDNDLDYALRLSDDAGGI